MKNHNISYEFTGESQAAQIHLTMEKERCNEFPLIPMKGSEVFPNKTKTETNAHAIASGS